MNSTAISISILAATVGIGGYLWYRKDQAERQLAAEKEANKNDIGGYISGLVGFVSDVVANIEGPGSVAVDDVDMTLDGDIDWDTMSQGLYQ